MARGGSSPVVAILGAVFVAVIAWLFFARFAHAASTLNFNGPVFDWGDLLGMQRNASQPYTDPHTGNLTQSF